MDVVTVSVCGKNSDKEDFFNDFLGVLSGDEIEDGMMRDDCIEG